jgi:hypothetical protein
MRQRTQDTSSSGSGRIKFRVIEFEVEGANDTLAEGIKALSNTLSKGSGSISTTARSLPPVVKTGAVAESVDLEDTGDRATQEDAMETQERDTVETTSHASRPKRSATPPTPTILSDIDLNAGKTSLKDYISQKTPSGAYQIYATIAVWYKENHSLDEVNANRIYTAYRFLEMVPPNDVPAGLRRLKFDGWFDKGGTKGAYKVNIVGINKVHGNFK